MKTLVLLRGIQGSGKSTWLKENNLDQFVISPDKLRILYSGICYNTDGSPYISQEANNIIWKDIFEKYYLIKWSKDNL